MEDRIENYSGIYDVNVDRLNEVLEPRTSKTQYINLRKKIEQVQDLDNKIQNLLSKFEKNKVVSENLSTIKRKLKILVNVFNSNTANHIPLYLKENNVIQDFKQYILYFNKLATIEAKNKNLVLYFEIDKIIEILSNINSYFVVAIDQCEKQVLTFFKENNNTLRIERNDEITTQLVLS